MLESHSLTLIADLESTMGLLVLKFSCNRSTVKTRDMCLRKNKPVLDFWERSEAKNEKTSRY